MRINEKQESILDSFVCERLSANDNNKKIVNSFKNSIGNGLINYLHTDGWEQDRCGEIAFYVIKSNEGMPCLFFGIKCGGVFQPFYEDDFEKQLEENNKKVKQISYNKIEKILTEEGNQSSIVLRMSRQIEKTQSINDNYQEYLDFIGADKKQEGLRPIQRVSFSFSGVEITHFCKNEDDKVKNMWNSLREQYQFRYPMGEVFFWKFIVPKFIDIQEIVGCQYVYLFAADRSEDCVLSNYYRTELHFQRVETLGVVKPIYDLTCEFLSQDVNSMKHNMEEFWENFNLDPDEDIV